MRKILCLFLMIIILFNLTSCSGGIADELFSDKPQCVSGIENYNPHASGYEITLWILYSKTFLTEYDYLDGEYNYFINGNYLPLPWVDNTDFYESCIFSLSYSPETYTSAKADLFSNMQYSSNTPFMIHNGFDFYRLKITESSDTQVLIHAFNDEKGEMVLMGCYANNENTLSSFLERGETWLDFLKTYFGEYYDFDA